MGGQPRGGATRIASARPCVSARPWRCPLGLLSCVLDLKRGFLWVSGFLHPDPIGGDAVKGLFLAALRSLDREGERAPWIGHCAAGR